MYHSRLFKEGIELNLVGLSYIFKEVIAKKFVNNITTILNIPEHEVNNYLSITIYCVDYEFTEKLDNRYRHKVKVTYEYFIVCPESGKFYETDLTFTDIYIISDKIFSNIFEIV